MRRRLTLAMQAPVPVNTWGQMWPACIHPCTYLEVPECRQPFCRRYSFVCAHASPLAHV
jgi:hypothetical protein